MAGCSVVVMCAWLRFPEGVGGWVGVGWVGWGRGLCCLRLVTICGGRKRSVKHRFDVEDSGLFKIYFLTHTKTGPNNIKHEQPQKVKKHCTVDTTIRQD